MNNIYELFLDPMMTAKEELHIFRNTYNKEGRGPNSFKSWKKSSLIFGSINVLLILIPIIFSVLNMIDNNSNLESSKFDTSEFEDVVKSFSLEEAKLNNFPLQLELETIIETRDKNKNENFSFEIEIIKSFGNCYLSSVEGMVQANFNENVTENEQRKKTEFDFNNDELLASYGSTRLDNYTTVTSFVV